MTTHLPMISGASLESMGWPDRRPSQAFSNAPGNWTQNNRALGYWFVPLQNYIAAGGWQSNTGLGGNWCLGVYDWGLNRLATTGSFVQTGGFQKVAFSGGNLQLLAGNAYAFMQGSDSTAGSCEMLQYPNAEWIRTEGVIQMDGAGIPLPAVIVPIVGDRQWIPQGGVYHS